MNDVKEREEDTNNLCFHRSFAVCGSRWQWHRKSLEMGNHVTIGGTRLIVDVKVSRPEGVVWKTDPTARRPERLGDQGG